MEAGTMEQTEGEVAQHNADVGALAEMDQTRVLPQGHILDAMAPILNEPMLPLQLQEALGGADLGRLSRYTGPVVRYTRPTRHTIERTRTGQ